VDVLLRENGEWVEHPFEDGAGAPGTDDPPEEEG
jgi:hypothetical protein